MGLHRCEGFFCFSAVDFFVYIKNSSSLDRYYVSHCQDMDERLNRHNGGDGWKRIEHEFWQLKESVPSKRKRAVNILNG
ncbi:hypothetical protein [uncultured Croceitalea sp.]|uniref:hypothetical protein n=1 Tax=uncultured Croceitalea sp. TaxID=1798908 RepID=UPI003305FAEA